MFVPLRQAWLLSQEQRFIFQPPSYNNTIFRSLVARLEISNRLSQVQLPLVTIRIPILFRSKLRFTSRHATKELLRYIHLKPRHQPVLD